MTSGLQGPGHWRHVTAINTQNEGRGGGQQKLGALNTQLGCCQAAITISVIEIVRIVKVLNVSN